MKVNLYKLFWPFLGLVVLLGLILGIMYFVSQPNNQEQVPQETLPDYEETQLPGKIIRQEDEPETPQREATEEDFDIPVRDDSLQEAEAPLSGGALKVPDEAALPPQEQDVLDLVLNSDGSFTPQNLKVQQASAVIIKLVNKKEDCIFVITRLGIAERVSYNQTMTISFRAPAETVDLDFHCELEKTNNELCMGTLSVE
jgi:hypothetical protein